MLYNNLQISIYVLYYYRKTVSIFSKTGGFKVINNGFTNRQETEYYEGETTEQSLVILFDLEAPGHCHKTPNVNCSQDTPPMETNEFTQVIYLFIYDCVVLCEYETKVQDNILCETLLIH